MMLLDDTTNRDGSDADAYVPGQNLQSSYQDNPLDDSDGYESNNPAQIPSADSGYNFANEKYGQQDPEFQDNYRNKIKGGIAKQAGRALGKVNSNLSSLGDLTDDSPENRERLKQEAKERIRKYAKEKVKDKFGEEMTDLSKDAIKKAGKDAVKNVGKNVAKNVGKEVGKDAAKVAVRAGAKVGAEVGAEAGVEAAVAGLGAASAPETAGIGLLIAILIEIALYLGLSDAIDYGIAMAKLDFKQARFHAQRGGMTVLMGFLLIITIGMCFSVVGWIIGVPLMVVLNIYMIFGLIFPKIGLLQGLSKRLLQAFMVLFDLIIIIIFLAFVASLFYWVCQESGLGSGFFANAITKVIDWWNGNEYASTFNDICTQISKF